MNAKNRQQLVEEMQFYKQKARQIESEGSHAKRYQTTAGSGFKGATFKSAQTRNRALSQTPTAEEDEEHRDESPPVNETSEMVGGDTTFNS